MSNREGEVQPPEQQVRPESIEFPPNYDRKAALILKEITDEQWKDLSNNFGVEKPPLIKYAYPAEEIETETETTATISSDTAVRVGSTEITQQPGYFYNLFYTFSRHIGLGSLWAKTLATSFGGVYDIVCSKEIRAMAKTKGPDNFWPEIIRKEGETGLGGLPGVHRLRLAIENPIDSSALEAQKQDTAQYYIEYLRNQELLGDEAGRESARELRLELEGRFGPARILDKGHTHNWGEYVVNSEWKKDTDPRNNTIRIIDPLSNQYIDVPILEYLAKDAAPPTPSLPLGNLQTDRGHPPLITLAAFDAADYQKGFDPTLGRTKTARRNFWKNYLASEGLRGIQLNHLVDKKGRVIQIDLFSSHVTGEAEESKSIAYSLAEKYGNRKDYSFTPQYQEKYHGFDCHVDTMPAPSEQITAIAAEKLKNDPAALEKIKADHAAARLFGIGSVTVDIVIPDKFDKKIREANKRLTKALLTRTVTREGERKEIILDKPEQDACLDRILEQSRATKVTDEIREALRTQLFESALSVQALAAASQDQNKEDQFTAVCVKPASQARIVRRKGGPATRLAVISAGDTSFLNELFQKINMASDDLATSDQPLNLESIVSTQIQGSANELRTKLIEWTKSFYRQTQDARNVGTSIIPTIYTASARGSQLEAALKGLADISGGNTLKNRIANNRKQESNIGKTEYGTFGFGSALALPLDEADAANNNERSIRKNITAADFVTAYNQEMAGHKPDEIRAIREIINKRINRPDHFPESFKPDTLPSVINSYIDRLTEAGSGDENQFIRNFIDSLRNRAIANINKEAIKTIERQAAYGLALDALFP